MSGYIVLYSGHLAALGLASCINTCPVLLLRLQLSGIREHQQALSFYFFERFSALLCIALTSAGHGWRSLPQGGVGGRRQPRTACLSHLSLLEWGSVLRHLPVPTRGRGSALVPGMLRCLPQGRESGQER